MRQPYELSIAVRYLRARSTHSFISFISAVSMIGIGLAVAVLIVVLSVMNGFEHELQQRILGMMSDATIDGSGGPLDDWRAMRTRALANPEIEAVAPFVEGQAMAVAGEALAGVSVRGVDPALEGDVSNIASLMQSGSLGALEPGSYRIVLGTKLAETLHVQVGDKVVLALATEARVTPAGLIPRTKQFTVAGVFSAGMYEYDRGLAFVSFDDAARLFRTDGRATGLRLGIGDVYNARRVAMDTARAIVDELGGKVTISDWTRQHYNYFRSIQLQKSIMFVILSLVIAVAAFNIVSTLMMVVRDKRGDIAILRSFGTTPRSVMTIFASQGTSIGVLGTLLGVLLALLFTWQLDNLVSVLEAWFGIDLLSEDVYFLAQLPTQLRWVEIAEISLLALALAVAATFYPALSAARQPPAEALRYE
ncbi:MAG TPA: lipoprotein-releasing ABC transporter permease subunit [Gammaproteobacteria bacterium]|nr:lipoprotein-releasing ABC transporter permease subunit [Gammaproteobacteria bacterium]